jgi:hypothetical protein
MAGRPYLPKAAHALAEVPSGQMKLALTTKLQKFVIPTEHSFIVRRGISPLIAQDSKVKIPHEIQFGMTY